MTHAHIQRVRLFLVLLERVLGRSHGGWADYDSLGEFRRLCWGALVLADDVECQAQIDLLVQYGNDLFSDHDHQKWEAAPLIGVDALRFRIRGALASLRARLDAMARSTTKNPRVASALPNAQKRLLPFGI
jgi:hypothetical protein